MVDNLVDLRNALSNNSGSDSASGIGGCNMGENTSDPTGAAAADDTYGLVWETYTDEEPMQTATAASSCCAMQNSMLFRSTKHASGVLANMAELREAGIMCDIELVCAAASLPAPLIDGNNEMSTGVNNDLQIATATAVDPETVIRAHKLVLSAASPYFRAMFCGGFREQHQGCAQLRIDPAQIAPSIMRLIVDFIYTARVLITEANVEQLLCAAKMLQLDDVVNAACVFLNKNMDANNCICIAEFARTYGCVRLRNQAHRFMMANFSDILDSEEFLKLTQQQLCQLLKCDELGVRCESIVFKAVVEWVKYDPEHRRTHLDHLFRCVRFHFLPPKFLKDQIATCEIFKLKDTGQSKQYLQEVCDDLIAHRPCPMSTTPRKPAFSLFVVGGYQRQSINLVECLKMCPTPSWHKCADMSIPRSGMTCVS